ncbi:hypothetical protein I5677_01680 [Mobilitalea sibirica]|uniref:Uncharacterized protein n=1 Tax=Mobilitalea sibirica TaxID=1462919 RepID=A0A8J7H4Q4_9FIRM|nr:hypothetical protein [Mobilitalea sibirica]MBH1939601.1 hypothetical protein [Mobilitalea sibirica]
MIGKLIVIIRRKDTQEEYKIITRDNFVQGLKFNTMLKNLYLKLHMTMTLGMRPILERLLGKNIIWKQVDHLEATEKNSENKVNKE